MPTLRLGLLLLTITTALMLAGCGHKLVPPSGESNVMLYPDKATFQKVQELKKQGGALGMLGGLGADIVAKRVDDQTPVRILSSDDDAVEVEVTGGPEQGAKGFVSRQNVD